MNPFKRMQAQHMVLGQLYTNDITDKRILQAMNDVPRSPFLPEALQGAAYVDRELQVGHNRSLMAPLTMAKLLDLAEIQQGNRILVVGCLSGYVAAIAAQLGSKVVAIETDESSIEQARAHMARLTLANVTFHKVASLAEGYAASAPYDVIIIAGAVDAIPDNLSLQLGVDGRLVCVRNIAQRPGSQGGLGKGLLVKRIDHKLQYREHFDASAMLLPGFQNDIADDNWKLVFGG